MNILKKIAVGILFAVILLAFVFGVLFVFEKESTEEKAYYDSCGFDFIIPSPWYSQIPEIKKMKFVDEIVPYYVTGQSVVADSKNAKIDIYLFEEKANFSNTSFSENMLVSGKTLSENCIVIDENASKVLGNVSVGDSVSISFGDGSVKFKVCGIVQPGSFSFYPTAAVFFTGKVKKDVSAIAEKLSYTGAFVKVNDISAAENYFSTKYRAMGKVGERSWYEDDESYKFMKKSIEEMSFAKEIMNISQSKANATSKTSETKKSNSKRILIVTAGTFLLNFLLWRVHLTASSSRIRDRIKNGTKMDLIVHGFRWGAVISALIFCIVLFKFWDITTISDRKILYEIICCEVLSTFLFCICVEKVIKRETTKNSSALKS